MAATELILLSRPGCHLCHRMEASLRPLLETLPVGLKVLDIDQFPDLLEQYGTQLPVLLHAGREICHHFLDEAKTREVLAGIR